MVTIRLEEIIELVSKRYLLVCYGLIIRLIEITLKQLNLNYMYIRLFVYKMYTLKHYCMHSQTWQRIAIEVTYLFPELRKFICILLSNRTNCV
jgi:hypothetical protein